MGSYRRVDHPVVAALIGARNRHIGAFAVQRTLPHPHRRTVGPFCFFDHFGPAVLAPGADVDVRPHPHIGLATVTWLFEGEIVHRDSLGTVQVVTPGAVGWMMAGSGIVHSERERPERRALSRLSHGLQLWVALPEDREEDPPSFQFHDDLPEVDLGPARGRVLVGEAWGRRSPVRVVSETLYTALTWQRAGALEVPAAPERGVYAVDVPLDIDGIAVPPRTMALLHPGATAHVRTEGVGRAVVIGGAPLDGPRHMAWNFVSSDPARLEEAARRWQALAFPPIPGDDEEFVALP